MCYIVTEVKLFIKINYFQKSLGRGVVLFFFSFMHLLCWVMLFGWRT